VAGAKQVIGAWSEAFNAHDEERMRALCAEDMILEAPGDVRVEGRDAAVGYAMSWLRAFPDAQLRIEDEFTDGAWAVQRFVFEGTHEDTLAGPAGEIPATHRRLSGRTVEIVRVEDGKIAESHLYFDQMQILMQLGLMPELAMQR